MDFFAFLFIFKYFTKSAITYAMADDHSIVIYDDSPLPVIVSGLAEVMLSLVFTCNTKCKHSKWPFSVLIFK